MLNSFEKEGGRCGIQTRSKSSFRSKDVGMGEDHVD